MKEKKLFWIIIFNLVIVFSEIAFGLISNSFALIADALHNAGDVMALVITFIALKLGTRKTTFKYTFGFIKAEMMAAFINTLFLSLTMFYMIYESIHRFLNPEVIEPIYMIIVGIIAVIANAVSAYLLSQMGMVHSHEHDAHTEHDHHEGEDANIKSAYLHMLADALISLGVVAAGIFIYFFKIYHVDSLLTILFSLYIIKHSYPLLKKSFLSLMDININGVKEAQIDQIIKEDAHVFAYHDLHIYKPSSKYNFISFHLVLDDENLTLKACEEIRIKIKGNLECLGFNHILIQLDTKKYHQTHVLCNL